MVNSLNSLAEISLILGRFQDAEKFAHQSHNLALELGFPMYVMYTSGTLSKFYKQKNNFKKSFEMYELYISMKDSLQNETNRKASIRKQFQYQYEKKSASDGVKHVEAQKVKNAQLSAQSALLKQEKTQRTALYMGLGLVIIFSVFVFNRYQLTQKQKLIIEKQKKQVEITYDRLRHKNKEIMDSIIYARKIQRQIMTQEKYFAKHLKNEPRT